MHETDKPRDSAGPGRSIPVGAGDYEIQFIHRQESPRFAPKDQGRWIDMSRLVFAPGGNHPYPVRHSTQGDGGSGSCPMQTAARSAFSGSPTLRLSRNASREIDLPLMEARS